MGRKKAQALLAALIAWPAAAQEYDPTLIPPQIIGSPQTMTQLNGGDDSTRLVQLGFPFQYYGQTFTTAWVSSNGFVSFQGPNPLCCDGQPMAQAQRNTIYAYWTDLIGNPNPYYRVSDGSALFGWYNTYEYGTRNSNTFEISLFSSGNIQINYGAVANSDHTVAAGLTGPTSADNLQLFYGTNVTNLSFQSGLLTPNLPEPEPEVPVPDAVDPAPDVTPDPTETQTEVLQDESEQEALVEAVTEEEMIVEETMPEEDIVSDDIVEQEEVDETQAEDANDEPLNPDELAALAAEAPEAPSEEEVAQATEAVATEAAAAEAARTEQQSQSGPDQTATVIEARRDRNADFFQKEAIEDADTFSRETVMQASLQNVAFLAQADAQYAQQFGQQTTTDTAGETYLIQPVEGPTFAASPVTGMGDVTTPVGQAQQMELLNMGMQGDLSSGPTIDVGDVNNGDSEAMSQLAAIPAGYSAYTQARIPDAPFYQSRDIYKGRRIPDANMALYRMMSGQDARWQEMVDEQYE
jgi:hypothetical protein